jgi:hypothetical protein
VKLPYLLIAVLLVALTLAVVIARSPRPSRRQQAQETHTYRLTPVGEWIEVPPADVAPGDVITLVQLRGDALVMLERFTAVKTMMTANGPFYVMERRVSLLDVQP